MEYFNYNLKMPIKDNLKPYIVALLVVLSTLTIGGSSLIDPDVWWHMSCGRELVANHSIDWSDFYFTEVSDNYSDLRFTFLGDILLYSIYCLGEEQALIGFRVLCIFSMCVFLFLCSDRKITWFKFFVLICMVAGCYQKIFIRNSMFALLYFPALLYLMQNKRYVLSVVVVSLWSITHGSYLLGIGTIAIMLLPSIHKLNLKILISLILLFIIVTYNNPMTKSVYSINTLKKVITADSLNQTLYNPGEICSYDFKDPLKLMKERYYIWFSYALGVMFLCFVKFRIKDYLLFIPISILGLGYNRFVPYIGIISVYLMFRALKKGHIRNFDSNIFIPITVGIIYFVANHYSYIIYPYASVNFDKCEMKFSDKAAIYAKEKYKDSDTFTTETNGGYVLFKHWYPEKRIFIDSFFQPHTKETNDQFKQYVRNPDSTPLHIKSALIGLNNINIVRMFGESKTWYPEYIDNGSVLFSREPVNVTLDFSQGDIDQMTDYHKQMFAIAIYNLANDNVSNLSVNK